MSGEIRAIIAKAIKDAKDEAAKAVVAEYEPRVQALEARLQAQAQELAQAQAEARRCGLVVRWGVPVASLAVVLAVLWAH